MLECVSFLVCSNGKLLEIQWLAKLFTPPESHQRIMFYKRYLHIFLIGIVIVRLKLFVYYN